MSQCLLDYSSRKKLRILQYGKTGSGKSVRAASMAKYGPVYIFDFDGKIGSLSSHFVDKPEVLKNVHYDEYTDKPGTITACLRVYAKLNELWAQCEKGECPYATIVFDSWTSWEQIALQQIMNSNLGFNRMQVNIGGVNELVPSEVDYRIHAHTQWMLLPKLTALPLNVFINCHTIIRQNKLTGAIEHTLAAAGKLAETLPKYFEEVHRTVASEEGFRVQVKPSYEFACNTTLKDLPQDGIIENELTKFEPLIYKLPEEDKKDERSRRPADSADMETKRQPVSPAE